MTGPGDDIERERELARGAAKTDGFIDWLDGVLEERAMVTEEDLAYGLVSAPDSHPEYNQAFHGFVNLVLDYADRNYLSFEEAGNSFPNSNANVSHRERTYHVRMMSGQGTAFTIRRVGAEDAASAHDSPIPLDDIRTDALTERAKQFNQALGELDETVAKLVEQGLPWYAIDATVRAQKPTS
jgi:hypothetical protein